MTARPEPHNPLYLLALVAGLLFVGTALAYALVPVLEQKAIDSGEPPPPSAWRAALRADGGKWLLAELGALTLLCLGSMWLDRRRALQSDAEQRTISGNTSSTASGVNPHGEEGGGDGHVRPG
ncbi:MAG: hypothetical protein ACRC33_00640 [Gemmataceae bacterium]